MIVLAQSEGLQAASPSAVRPGLRHCGREPWSRPALNRKGTAMKEYGMAVDAALWVIFATMVGWVVLGCFLTARHRRAPPQRASRH
jgi:hypothetical protein